jgi:hypothetical protein
VRFSVTAIENVPMNTYLLVTSWADSELRLLKYSWALHGMMAVTRGSDFKGPNNLVLFAEENPMDGQDIERSMVSRRDFGRQLD